MHKLMQKRQDLTRIKIACDADLSEAVSKLERKKEYDRKKEASQKRDREGGGGPVSYTLYFVLHRWCACLHMAVVGGAGENYCGLAVLHPGCC